MIFDCKNKLKTNRVYLSQRPDQGFEVCGNPGVGKAGQAFGAENEGVRDLSEAREAAAKFGKNGKIPPSLLEVRRFLSTRISKPRVINGTDF